MTDFTDTIAAIATASGPAGVSVIRISGPEAFQIGDQLVACSETRKTPSQQKAGTFFYAGIQHPITHVRIDDGLFLVFHAPHSFTGEDTVEVQGHGGQLPSGQILQAALAAGARLAEPGEFSKRAFLNGRMDLTQAEAIIDFIQAKSIRVAELARAQLDGALGSRLLRLYTTVTGLCAEVEYLLDFDEQELSDGMFKPIQERIRHVQQEVAHLGQTWKTHGHLLREGALVVISGKPNVGKSSLLNALLGHARAIVNDRPGTTRDSIEEGCVVHGIPLRLVDTAGIRATNDCIEQEGIARSRQLIEQADINLRLFDATDPEVLKDIQNQNFKKNDILVVTKADLCQNRFGIQNARRQTNATCVVSTKTGEGLDLLKQIMIDELGCTHLDAADAEIVSARQAAELDSVDNALTTAIAFLDQSKMDCVLLAHHLQCGAEALGRMTGRVYSEDLLDAVFSRFCVGK